MRFLHQLKTFFLRQLFSKYPLNKHSHHIVIDPKVVQYVVNIMNEKNAQLGQPAFGRIFIDKICEKFINLPNAMAVKNITPNKYLYLTQTSMDVLEHVVLNEEATEYIFTVVAPWSPYTMKINMPKKAAENMMRFIVEHELGHLYFPHHCRLYAPHIWLKIALSCMLVMASSYMMHVFPSYGVIILFGVWPIHPIMGIMLGALVGVFGYIQQLRNSSYEKSTYWETEADDFVTADAHILHGGITFLEIYKLAKLYVYPYQNEHIRFAAWRKNMDASEFVKKYPEVAHYYYEANAPYGDAHHPTSEDRIEKLKQRIAQLPAQDAMSDSKGYTNVTVYHGTKLIHEFKI